MTHSFLFTVLRARYPLILFTLIATVAAGLYFSAREEARYTASTSLIINLSSSNPFEETNLPPQLADNYFATQVEIITSRAVARQVAEVLEPDSASEQELLAPRLLNSVSVNTSRDSRVIQILFEASSPQYAAKVANLFAVSYIENANRLHTEPAERNAELLTTQVDAMRSRLELAQSKLSEAEKAQGITGLDQRLDSENLRLSELSNQLVAAQGATYETRARRLGVNHPEYIGAVQSERAIEAALSEQKRRVLDLKQRRDVLSVLSRDVDIEREAYEVALQSYYQQTLQSSIDGISVAILDEATAPSQTSNTAARYTLAGTVFLGLILGLVFAILAESIFRKTRTEKDLGELIDPSLVREV